MSGVPAQRSAIGVVVVTYNSEGHVERLLDSLPEALDGLPAEIVVVDNGSTDGTVTALRRRSDCRVIEQENLGYAAGLNRGMRELRSAPCVLLLNPDTTAGPRSIVTLVAALEAGTDIGIAVPRVRSNQGNDESARREPSLPRSLGLSRTGLASLSERIRLGSDERHLADVDWATGAAMLVSRRCLDEVGAWDESYFMYSEETDFCRAARDRGLRVVVEQASVISHAEGGSGRSPITHSMQALNRVRYYRRHHAALPSSVYWALTAAQEALWAARKHPGSPEALAALVRPPRRPPQLARPQRLLPR